MAWSRPATFCSSTTAAEVLATFAVVGLNISQRLACFTIQKGLHGHAALRHTMGHVSCGLGHLSHTMGHVSQVTGHVKMMRDI